MAVAAPWDRRLWEASRWSFLSFTACAWLLALVTPVFWGTGSDPAFVGTVALIFAVVLTPWAWLPVSVWPSRLTTVDGRRLGVATCRRIESLDLERVVSVDARTLPGRPSPIPFLSVRDDQGTRVVLVWESVSDEVKAAVRAAVTEGKQVMVTGRAAALLGLGSAPLLRERLRLSLQTGAVFLGACLVLSVVVVRFYLGIWIWQT